MAASGAVLRFVIISSVAVALLVLVVGFVLPTSWEASRTATFEDASPRQVADAVGDLSTWPEWSVWSAEADETIEVDVTGAGFAWKSEPMGDGVLTVTAAGADSVAYGLTSGDLQSSGELAWRAADEDGGTVVTWKEWGEVDGGPLIRWYAFLSADAIVGGRFEGALERLEERL